MKAFNLSRGRDVLFYAVCFALFYFTARARIDGAAFGLALGLYAALTYCRCGYVPLTVVYTAACIAADWSLGGIIYAFAPIVVFGVAKAVHYKLAKPMKLLAVNIYAVLSIVPMIFISLGKYSAAQIVSACVTSQIICYLCAAFCYAVIVRGISYRMSPDEILGGVALITAVSAGLYGVAIWKFLPYYFVVGACVIYCVHGLSPAGALLTAVGVGLGGALASHNAALLGGIVLIAASAALFRKLNVWICLAAMVLVDALCGLYLGCFDAYNWQHALMLAAGGGVFAAIPKSRRERMTSFVRTDGTVGAKNVLNRTRRDLSGRIATVSKLFYDMADLFGRGSYALPSPENVVGALAKQASVTVCSRCEERGKCMAALGGDTASMFEGVISCALSVGKASLVDLPPFMTSRCKRIPAVLSTCNSVSSDYPAKLETAKALDEGQRVMASQLAGVGGMLSKLSGEIKSSISVDCALEEKIVQELGYCNVVCTEVIILVSDGKQSAALVVRESDVDKKALAQVVSRMLGAPMEVCRPAAPIDGGRASVTLLPVSRYSLCYGEAARSKTSGAVCGDARSVVRIGNDKVLIALCDGMGSGEGARNTSLSTLGLVQSFYKAGFDNDVALGLINRLFVMSGKDNFSALDMCLADLDDGVVDFIKLGGVESFVCRENVEIIEANALPLGIVEEARPSFTRVMVNVGDMVVMVSDGITEALTVGGVKLIIERTVSCNPQQIADEILQQAVKRGCNDDATVVAFRLYGNAA